MSDPLSADPVVIAIGGAAITGLVGLFWRWVASNADAREKQAAEFREEVRRDLKDLKELVVRIDTAQQVSVSRAASLEMRVANLERRLESLSEGSR